MNLGGEESPAGLSTAAGLWRPTLRKQDIMNLIPASTVENALGNGICNVVSEPDY